MAVASTTNRGKGKRKMQRGGSPSTNCFKGSGKKCGPLKRKVEKVVRKVKKKLRDNKNQRVIKKLVNNNVKFNQKKKVDINKLPTAKLPTKPLEQIKKPRKCTSKNNNNTIC